jgi:hypothetical protein
MATRFPLALSEMRWPSVPLHMVETQPLARWGIEIHAGWRSKGGKRPYRRLDAGQDHFEWYFGSC